MRRIGEVLGSDTPRGRVTVTIPNYLTIGRFLVVPFFWYGFFSTGLGLQMTATVLFALGAISDLWDGKIARLRGEITAFGDFMDPLADKLLVLSGFWAILIRENLGAWEAFATIWVVVITIRELALTLLRMSVIRSGSSMVTSGWGKWKTGVQLTSLLFAMVAYNLRDYLIGIGEPWNLLGGSELRATIAILFLLSAVTSVISGYLYLREGRIGSRT